jgi:hypothetical protein
MATTALIDTSRLSISVAFRQMQRAGQNVQAFKMLFELP